MHSIRFLLIVCFVFTLLYTISAADHADTTRRRRGHEKYSKKKSISVRYYNRHSTANFRSTTTTKRAGPSTTKRSTKTTTTKTPVTTTTSKAITTSKAPVTTTTSKAITTTTKVPVTTTTSKATTTTTTTTKTTTSSAAQTTSTGTTYTGDATYYNPGLGSCGQTNTESDLIVALNHIQMANGANPNNNPNCGRHLAVTGPKGSVTVKIVDTCPGCVSGDIDLSPAAFAQIADISAGRVTATWYFAD